MKILYAIQGTGNGHLSRAKAIYPELKQFGEVDILISGYQADVSFPFPVKYRFTGLSFIFGKQGGIAFGETLKRMRPLRLLRNILQLPVDHYDLIVNDFEPVSAWACRWNRKPCIALSHQSAVIRQGRPAPKGWLGKMILHHYAPFSDYYGFHFTPFANKIFPPVIRQEVQDLIPTNEGHITVYLPAYDDATLVRFLLNFPGKEWAVFSKHNKSTFRHKNILVQPVENTAFLRSLATCDSALLGAGFEGPAEALFLKKKLMVIPMKGQYEQQSNAAAMKALGIPVIPALKRKYSGEIAQWLSAGKAIDMDLPKDTAERAVHTLMENMLSTQRAGTSSGWR